MKEEVKINITEKESQRQLRFIEHLRDYYTEKSEELQRPLTCHIATFGCQMNARDSEKILGTLEQIGFKEVDTEEADFVIYNTCTVRENANLKVYGRLGHLSQLKKKNPHMLIALCGCMMQEDAVVDKIKKSYRFVDIIFGTHNIFKLAELIQARLDSKDMIIDIWKDATEIVEDLPSERKYKFKAGVNIMFGCNNFCTYCIVPYVRGRERSRNPEDIIKEIKDLVADGVVEIMLLGQNVNSYGKNLEEPMTFAGLLREIEKIDGLERVRFMTSHPKDLSDDLIDAMKDSKKICTHLHLPVQSGSSRILKIMNRHYTKEQYLNLVDRIKNAIPNISLTTDIIVGFPGETEEDFLETLDVIRKVRYESAFTFVYSKRTGTPAANMEEQVDDEVVKDRFNRLLKEVKIISSELTGRETGTVQKVLVEGINEQDSELVTGRLSNNLLVHFKGSTELIGRIVNVKLVECKGFYYIGEMVEAQ
ncbi:tRNA (N6-isopentenyl adenosine(37)-C2)-methylthiotransferase MiaB [Anaeromicropila herbilytica]|uniref:tRNA-2-methylthio-N(6)-dimethylallyladenosine synthase n=1 Tax=Anaeromicropila herbilytica TaxID=2785025 RepID=A0A7R7ICD8_9FIRM|nr:tRNA (N6-isopentenyl adenosine(37)-C2)-methylthiotransferase MiaB [Anaeromicropila herbilytica]BCN30633.1 tRNA-2-methylthio-N(6)-dimethylallyladenosine synthase [Anaeromicropila herbilytica]